MSITEAVFLLKKLMEKFRQIRKTLNDIFIEGLLYGVKRVDFMSIGMYWDYTRHKTCMKSSNEWKAACWEMTKFKSGLVCKKGQR